MSQEKMKILEMVENKVITVEEGLKLLNALEKEEAEEEGIIKEFNNSHEELLNDVDQMNQELSEEFESMKEDFKEELTDEIEDMEDEIEDEIDDIVEEIEDQYEDVSEEMNSDAAEALNEKVEELKEKAEKLKSKIKIDLNINGEKIRKEFDTAEFGRVFGNSIKRDFANLKRSFRGDLKSFAKEAKRFGNEMSRFGVETANITKEAIDDAMSNINEMNFNTEFKEEDFVLEDDKETRNYTIAQEFSIDCDGKKDISIGVVSTDITIITEERDDILVNYIKYNPKDEDKFQVVVEEDSKKVRITEKQLKKNNAFFYASTSGRELLVRLPRKYKESLSVKSVSGDLDMNYLDSDFFRFSSVSGDMTADIIYSVNSLIKTTSGDAEIGLFRGNMMFNSVSGDLQMKYEKLDGDFTMKSVSGDAEVALPKNSEFEVIGKTLSGDVKCEFPLTMIGTQKRGRLRGQVGSDAFKISASTTSGDLEILRY